MSGFYEVTTAPKYDWRRETDPNQGTTGQLNHESSRRQPHPPQQAGHHRPTTHATQLNQPGVCEHDLALAGALIEACVPLPDWLLRFGFGWVSGPRAWYGRPDWPPN
jgi:hypothetical protein